LPIPLLVSKTVTLATGRVIRECIFKIKFLCVLFFREREKLLTVKFIKKKAGADVAVLLCPKSPYLLGSD
jgi:hypothetical protein